MKIHLIAPSLAGGGAESVLLETASMLFAAGHAVTVVTLEGEESDAYTCAAHIDRVAFGLPALSANKCEGIRNNLESMRLIRSFVRQHRPDVVISYLTRTNVRCLLALRGLHVPTIVTEHNEPLLNETSVQPLWRCLRRLLYTRADHVVTVSHGIAQYYSWVPRDRISVIYNSVREDPPRPAEFPFIKPGIAYIAGMGRLVHTKGFDLLIRAFSIIASAYPSWNLLILGEGELRRDLTKLARSLNLSDRVKLPGRISQPRPVLERCRLFVLSSRQEGFSNALTEAQSAGLPVVSFDCKYGPGEIISHNWSGILVSPGDVDALAAAMRMLIEDQETCRRLAENARSSVERFRRSQISRQWLDLIARVGGAPHPAMADQARIGRAATASRTDSECAQS
jgi:GalNAc-alpha-(1->4)-GalNAc-alpha-(1->3)-diNAcBac-PP-undecaprenol alpha-1,4-N-acetyl-D-galactosaminyltransferase